MFQRGVDTVATLGALFWDYSVYSYSGVGITEDTEYQFPKEQTSCYSENRIGDVARCGTMWVGGCERNVIINNCAVCVVCVFLCLRVCRIQSGKGKKRDKGKETETE